MRLILYRHEPVCAPASRYVQIFVHPEIVLRQHGPPGEQFRRLNQKQDEYEQMCQS